MISLKNLDSYIVYFVKEIKIISSVFIINIVIYFCLRLVYKIKSLTNLNTKLKINRWSSLLIIKLESK